MSWLDGLVEDNEAASQDQRLGRTEDKPAPGVFAGVSDAFGQGLVRGGIEAVNTAKSLVVQAAGADQAMGLGLSGMVLDGQDAEQQIQQINTDTERRADAIGKDTAQAVELLRPDPTEVGVVGQILSEAAAILPRTVVGTMLAGPVGGAVAAGGPAGFASKQTAVAEGIDETTAYAKGGVDALTTGLGVVLPAARFVKPLLGDAAIAVGANVGLGMAGRGATAALLESGGYHAQAAQYHAMDGTAIATDAILGAAFFGIGRAGFRRPTTEQVDAALAERTYQHADIDTAPGAPISPKSAVAHQDAIQTAIAQLTRGEPVVLPDNIHSAEFLRTTENSSAVPAGKGKAAEAGLEIDNNENSFRYVIKDEGAPDQSHLPGVEPHEIGRIVGNVTPDSIKVTTATIGDDYSGKGVGTDAYAKLADQAFQSGRSLVSDIEVSKAAARVYEKLADRGYSVTRNPAAKLEDVEGEAKWVSASGPVFKVERPASEASTPTSMAQVAQQEIRRILDDIERTEPTLQVKPLDIGTPKEAVKQEAKGSAPASKAPKSGSEPAKPASESPDAASAAGKPASDPEIQVADEILSRMDDMRLSTGAMDADGNPITVSAREMMAQADADIVRAQEESRGFAAAAACFLQRGV